MEPINHREKHAAGFASSLLLLDTFSDVTLVVCGQKLPAHKAILVANSEYFGAMFCGGLKEAGQKMVTLSGVTSLDAFKAILGYLYTGCMSLEGLSSEVLMSVMRLGHEYCLGDLTNDISKAVLSLSTQNLDQLLILFDYAVLFDLKETRGECRAILETKSLKVLANDTLMQMTAASLKELLSSNNFVANEIDIFVAIKRWIDNNPDGDKKLVLSSLRLALISNCDMLKIIKPTGLIDADRFLEAFAPELKKWHGPRVLRYLGPSKHLPEAQNWDHLISWKKVAMNNPFEAS